MDRLAKEMQDEEDEGVVEDSDDERDSEEVTYQRNRADRLQKLLEQLEKQIETERSAAKDERLKQEREARDAMLEVKEQCRQEKMKLRSRLTQLRETHAKDTKRLKVQHSQEKERLRAGVEAAETAMRGSPGKASMPRLDEVTTESHTAGS